MPTVPELRAQAKQLGLSGYSKLNKDALVALIARHKKSPQRKGGRSRSPRRSPRRSKSPAKKVKKGKKMPSRSPRRSKSPAKKRSSPRRSKSPKRRSRSRSQARAKAKAKRGEKKRSPSPKRGSMRDLSKMTNAELKTYAKELKIALPSGYVKNDLLKEKIRAHLAGAEAPPVREPSPVRPSKPRSPSSGLERETVKRVKGEFPETREVRNDQLGDLPRKFYIQTGKKSGGKIQWSEKVYYGQVYPPIYRQSPRDVPLGQEGVEIKFRTGIRGYRWTSPAERWVNNDGEHLRLAVTAKRAVAPRESPRRRSRSRSQSKARAKKKADERKREEKTGISPQEKALPKVRDLEKMTVKELRTKAGQLGINLPSGYVKKDVLIQKISAQEEPRPVRSPSPKRSSPPPRRSRSRTPRRSPRKPSPKKRASPKRTPRKSRSRSQSRSRAKKREDRGGKEIQLDEDEKELKLDEPYHCPEGEVYHVDRKRCVPELEIGKDVTRAVIGDSEVIGTTKAVKKFLKKYGGKIKRKSSPAKKGKPARAEAEWEEIVADAERKPLSAFDYQKLPEAQLTDPQLLEKAKEMIQHCFRALEN